MIVVYYWPIMAMPSPRIRGLIFFQGPNGIAQARPYAARLHLIPLFCEDAQSILIDIYVWHTHLVNHNGIYTLRKRYSEKYIYHEDIGMYRRRRGHDPKAECQEK